MKNHPLVYFVPNLQNITQIRWSFFSEATPIKGGLCEVTSCYRFRIVRHLNTSFYLV